MASVMVWCASGLSEPRRHGGSDEAAHDGGSGFHLVKRQAEPRRDGSPTGRAIRWACSRPPGCRRHSRPERATGRLPAAPRARSGHYLQSLHGLRLPAMRLGTIVFAEANPAIIRKGFGFSRRDRLLRGGCGRLRLLMSGVDQGRLDCPLPGPQTRRHVRRPPARQSRCRR